jgi:superoxide reductase
MTARLEIYKCERCGNIIEMLHGATGVLECCEAPMKLLVENTVDAAQEKHVPVVEKQDRGYLVKVGSVSHPMEEKHHIEWIELVADNRVYRQFLNPGEEPQAFFAIDAESISVREYCNLHGLWKV